ncbi:Plasminogen, partial [Lamellibrachia satsuma]
QACHGYDCKKIFGRTPKAAKNYCRNSGQSKPGCYTSNGWEDCDIPSCDPDTLPLECLLSVSGTEYIGHVSITKSGNTCQRWSAQTPRRHTYTDIHMFPDSSFDAASNHCRSPDRRNRPWCYTTNKDKRWEHCDIPMCSSTTEIQCPERIIPEDPHLEHVPGGGVKPGSVASFKCATGYNLIGSSSTIGCTPRGFWKDVLPHCESYTFSPTGIDIRQKGRMDFNVSPKRHGPSGLNEIASKRRQVDSTHGPLDRRSDARPWSHRPTV